MTKPYGGIIVLYMQQRQALFQTQQFKMNTQLYQSIKLMELPVMDLREKIGEELEKNPALEVLEESHTVSIDAAAEKLPKEEESFFEASSDAGFIYSGMDSDRHHQFLEGAISRPETLQEHLLWQLALETSDDEVLRLGSLLIQNLDDDGFHKVAPEILLEKENPAGIYKAMALVQSLDPPGTCTSDYRESLLVQTRLLPVYSREMETALDYLEELEKGKFTEISRLLHCKEESLRRSFSRIKEELFPFPGRRFFSAETNYAVPDVEVTRKDGDLVIILNDEEIPLLGINPFFLKIAEEKTNKRETRDFARDNIREAKWFIQSINQRNHTLLRVSRAIVEFQRPFFANGPKYLSPLTQKDIALELGIHETTVSRSASGKYMQTEWGLFELRHFFSNSATRGSRFSREGVKEMLKEIISSDTRLLSDQELADLLAQRGIALARRTVAKYRNELDLGSSYTRK